MTNRQDTNSKVEAESLDSLKDAAQNTASKISTSEKDALSDRSLDDVSGGSWPFSATAKASYMNGPGG